MSKFTDFFKRIGEFFSKLFKSLLPELKKAVDIGVRVTDAIKNFDTSMPWVGDLITKVIPGDVDAKILVILREKLPQIVVELKLVDATLRLTDPNEIMQAAIKVIQQLAGDYRSAFLNSLAILISQAAADGKLDWDDAVYLIKWYYDHRDNTEVDTEVS